MSTGPATMDVEEAKRILGAFETEGVEYVLVGAMATAAHGLIRATRDVARDLGVGELVHEPVEGVETTGLPIVTSGLESIIVSAT